jgi:hypothetical protein
MLWVIFFQHKNSSQDVTTQGKEEEEEGEVLR